MTEQHTDEEEIDLEQQWEEDCREENDRRIADLKAENERLKARVEELEGGIRNARPMLQGIDSDGVRNASAALHRLISEGE